MRGTYHNLILHASISSAGNGLDCASIGHHGIAFTTCIASSGIEVVLHLCIEFLRRLWLTTAGVATTGRTSTTPPSRRLTSCGLRSRGWLRLRFGCWFRLSSGNQHLVISGQVQGNLRDTVAQALSRDWRRGVFRTQNHFDFHRATVNLNSIESLGSFSCTTRFGEDDSGDTTTLTIRAVCEKDLLNWANSFAEIFLRKKQDY